MKLPEGFPPLDDLLPVNLAVYTPPEKLSELFTSGESLIWDYNIGRHFRRDEDLYVQGYYACLVEVLLMTGLAVGIQIPVKVEAVAAECCLRFGRLFRIKPSTGMSWLNIGFHGQKSWDDPIPTPPSE